VNQVPEREPVAQFQAFHLAQQVLDHVVRLGGGEVEDRPRHRGHRNPLLNRPLIFRYFGDVTADQVIGAAAVRDGDDDAFTRARPKHPQRRCRVVAEDGFGSRSRYGRHPSSFPGDEAMAYGVDPGMHLVQAPSAQSPPDCARLKPQVKQLTSRHHSVLALRQVSDLPIDFASPRQCPHIGLFRGLDGHAPTLAGNLAQLARGLCQLCDGRCA
jgi:hypothetical protein